MIELIGYIGAIALGVCALPQAIKVYKEKNARGMDKYYLIGWGGGMFCMAIYTNGTIGFYNPLMLSYIANALFLSVITFYKLFPKD